MSFKANKPLNAVVVVVLLHFSGLVLSKTLIKFVDSTQYEGSGCQLADGVSEGICRHHSRCPQLKDVPQSQWTTCSFDVVNGHDPIVCCKEDDHVGGVAEKMCQGFPQFSGGTNHVFGGTEAEIDDFPYVAALGWNATGDGRILFKCGASLISQEFLLTAAHCLTSSEGKPSMARFGVVKLFDYNRNDAPVDVGIRAMIVHPEWMKNDIALVKLERPITEEFIKPICLYTGSADPSPVLNLTIAGWGSNDTNADILSNPVLLKGQVNAWSPDNCNQTIRRNRLRYGRKVAFLQDKLCASKTTPRGDTAVDACSGDSGGPLELAVGRRRYLVAVISSGPNCGSTGQPGFYTRVANYIEWIELNVWGKNLNL